MAVNFDKSDTVLPRIRQNYEQYEANRIKGIFQTDF